MNIPRKDSKEVQRILNTKELTNFEKAKEIYYYHYNCLCRETNGHIKNLYTIGIIKDELDKVSDGSI